MERAGETCGSVVKNLPANAGDARQAGLIPGSGRSPGEENGNPLQYSCLENPMGRGGGGLQSMGLQMVRHTEATLHTHPWSYLPEASKVFTKTRKMERK